MIFLHLILAIVVFLEVYSRLRIANHIVAKLKLIETYSSVSEIVVLGNSHARNGFVSNRFPRSTINLALGGTTVFYTLEMFKLLLEKESPELKVAFVSISYQTMFKDYSLENTLDRRFEYNIYLKSAYNLPEAFDFREYSVLGATSFKAVIDNLKSDFAGDIYNVYNNRGFTNVVQEMDSFQVESLASKRIQSHHTMMTEDSAIYQENIGYLREILVLCQERNITAILITPPVTSEYFKLEQNNYRAALLSALLELSHEFNFIYWDDSQLFDSKSLEYFADPDHLNGHGAEVYTDSIIGRLASLDSTSN